MAFRQDYILRMIQQLSEVIVRIVGLRRDGRTEEALVEIGDAYGRLAGLNPSLIHALSEDDLVALLKARGALDPERGIALAELLREEVAAYDDLGRDDESFPRALKALRLYLEVLPDFEEAAPESVVTGLEEIIARLTFYELPSATRLRLLGHFEDTGRFDRAEDLLLEGLDADEPTPEVVAQARAFYERLLTKTDADLDAGGLPRAEVRDGLAGLVVLAGES